MLYLLVRTQMKVRPYLSYEKQRIAHNKYLSLIGHRQGIDLISASSETAKSIRLRKIQVACCVSRRPGKTPGCGAYQRFRFEDRPHVRVNTHAFRGRNGKQTNSSFKPRTIRRLRRDGSRFVFRSSHRTQIC